MQQNDRTLADGHPAGSDQPAWTDFVSTEGGVIQCTRQAFGGDPARGRDKTCECMVAAADSESGADQMTVCAAEGDEW